MEQTRPRRLLCFSAYSANLRAVAFIKWLREEGYDVIVPPPHGPPGSVLELALTLIPYCWKALTCRADLTAGFKPHLNVTLPLLICKLRGIPTWIDVDDLDHAYRAGWVSRLVERLQRPFPRRFTVVSYHNLKLKDFLIEQMRCRPDRLVRIPQGVDYAFFNQPCRPAVLPDGTGKRIAIYAAHLNVASDLEPVLRVWQLVVRRVPDSLLLVIGGGPMLSDFTSLTRQLGLSANVRFTGEIAHADVPRYFALAQIALLYMSRRLVNEYRCSLKLREYLAAGLKVVCNDFGELTDFAELTYQTTASLQDFADMITRVLEGYDDGRQRRAQRFAAEELDWPRIIQAGAADVLRQAGLAAPHPVR